MGLLDLFGGSEATKAQKLKAKVTQKYGDALNRQKAIQQLGEMKVPEATTSLLARFSISVEPATTDADEKQHVFELIRDQGKDAVPQVLEFLRRTDLASSWAVRLLEAALPREEVIGLLTDYLRQLGPEYMRNPEKKIVMLHHLAEQSDPRIAPVVTPFLEDPADDVKLAALKVLGPLKHEPAREPMLALLTGGETARRVQTAALEALHQSGFGVQGYREKVEALLVEPYFVDKAGVVKRRP